jgi:gluconokinase
MIASDHVHPRSVVLAVDVGSSSVRCSAYDVIDYTVVASSSQQRKSVDPGTGQIILFNTAIDHDAEGKNNINLLDVIDTCVDDVLRQVLVLQPSKPATQECFYKVVAIGFSTFVMNLVGVDDRGLLIGHEASMSYTCSQSPEVNAEVENLKR